MTIQMKAIKKYLHLVLRACYAVQDGSTFEVCGWNPREWPFKLKLSSSGFIAYFVVMYKIVDTNSIHGACVTMKAV